MKTIKHVVIYSMFLNFIFPVFSQETTNFCGTSIIHNKWINEHPELKKEFDQADQQLEEYTKQFIKDNKSSSRAEIVYTIPVVFHVIHNYGVENISNEQIEDAIRILNEDYNKLNADTSSIVSGFKAIAGNVNINFKLAQKDPLGNCTNGITRTASIETNKGNNIWGNTALADLIRWPRNKYLNIWVVNAIEGGSAGYAYLPANVNGNTSSKMDGIVLIHRYIGSIGTGDPLRSRALTHEVGHWLNLNHTWGKTNEPGCDGTATSQSDPCYGINNCDQDDGVDDTPNTIGYKTCKLSGTSCGTLDNVQNFMEYSYCSNMFTIGQVARMRAALTSSTAQRNSLWTSSNLTATGTNDAYNSLCFSDFSVDKTVACVGQVINFKDLSYNGVKTWSWNFEGASQTNYTVKNPAVIYNSPGTYSVSLTVGDGIQSKTIEKKAFIQIVPLKGTSLPVSESFEGASLSVANWNIQNPDNGITWQINNQAASSGSYSLKLNNFSNDSNKTDILISNNIDLSGKKSVVVSFKVAYAQKNSASNDILKFYVSNDCGQTWSLRFVKSGNLLASAPFQTQEFTPTTSQWQEFKVTSISSIYMVPNFKIKFEFTSANGNNIYMDDIQVLDPSAVGMDKLNALSDLAIYPNPFNENAVISYYLNKPEKITVLILDVLGREVYIENGVYHINGETRLNLSKSLLGLKQGVYTLIVKSAEEKICRKIVIN